MADESVSGFQSSVASHHYFFALTDNRKLQSILLHFGKVHTSNRAGVAFLTGYGSQSWPLASLPSIALQLRQEPCRIALINVKQLATGGGDEAEDRCYGIGNWFSVERAAES